MTIAYVTKINACAKIHTMSVFGEKLRAWRESKGLSGWAIEKTVGVSNFRMVLSNVENGRRPPSEEFIKRIASIPELELTYDRLLAWKLIDEHGADTLRDAFKVLESEG